MHPRPTALARSHSRPIALARSHPRLGLLPGAPLVRALLVPVPLRLGGRATWWPALAAPTATPTPRPAPGPPLQTPPPPAPRPSHD